MVTADQDELRVSKGTIIFRQGDPGDEMFVVSEGRVRLTLGAEGHEKEISVAGKGEFFGELSLLSGAARTATAEAVDDTVLLRIGRDVFKMLVQDDLDIVFWMFDIQGQRLSRTNQPIQELMQRLGRIRIVAEGLRRCAAAGGQSPVTLSVDELVAAMRISAKEVTATVAGLADQGAGTLQDGRWTIQGTAHTQQLVAALCRYAEPPTE